MQTETVLVILVAVDQVDEVLADIVGEFCCQRTNFRAASMPFLLLTLKDRPVLLLGKRTHRSYDLDEATTKSALRGLTSLGPPSQDDFRNLPGTAGEWD